MPNHRLTVHAVANRTIRTSNDRVAPASWQSAPDAVTTPSYEHGPPPRDALNLRRSLEGSGLPQRVSKWGWVSN
jgi:hypothetical protein